MADVPLKVPENFHALYDRAARSLRVAPVAAFAAKGGGVAFGDEAGHSAVDDLSFEMPDLTLHLDEATHNPVQLMVNTDTAERAAAALSLREADSPEDAARQFVEDRGALWKLDDSDIGTVDVVSVSRQGLPTVRMIQKVDGVEVFQSDMTAALNEDNRVISVKGQLFHGAAAARERGSERAAAFAKEGTPKIGEEEAIAKAAFDLTGYAYEASDFKLEKPAQARANDAYRHYVGKAAGDGSKASARRGKAAMPGFIRPVRLKDVLFPMGNGQFIPGYYIELWVTGYPAFSYVIDHLDTPDILFRKNLTSRIAFKYRVHNTCDAVFRPQDGPAPGTPHPTGKPDKYQAPTISEQMVQIESLLHGRPWLPDTAKTTRGNNCIAYADLKPPEGLSAGDVEGEVTAPLTFDTPYDHALPSDDPRNLQASIVGMFFHVNWLHDRWYEAGFDEASGNAQQDKFGLGGIDGDPVLAGGNHYSGHDNANMSTPAEGSSPYMHMFRFDGCKPKPNRTSNHEALITFHEMGHYITNRLVGNASGLTNQQGEAMGEGWGDFFAICMTSQATDDFTNGTFAVGGWTDLQPKKFEDNYYYSIRRFPYTADMTKNPLTFRHISTSAVLPKKPTMNPIAGGANEEVHNAGEIWCCALWEVFVNLVAAQGHDEAEERMLKYVIGGLKLTPTQPTFVQARDGILAAAKALHPEDIPAIWKGFAKRGLGKSAKAPPSTSTAFTEAVEKFDVP